MNDRPRQYGNYSRRKRPRTTLWNRRNKKRNYVDTSDSTSDNDSSGEVQESINCGTHNNFDASSTAGDCENHNFENSWDVSSISSGESINTSSISSNKEELLWDSDFETDEPEERLDSMPLFLDCPISREDSFNLVLAFSNRHHVTDNCLEDLLKLIKMHLPSNTHYPATKYKFEQNIKLEKSLSKNCYYCIRCEKVLPVTLVCEICEFTYTEKKLISDGNYFVLYDIRKQFEILLKDTRICKSMQSSLEHRRLCSAEEFRNIYGEKMCTLELESYDFTCMFNTDGVPVFKSSKFSIWPVLFVINDLDYKYKKNNVLMGALWFGAEKINISLVFSQLVPVLNDLAENPLSWKLDCGLVVQSRVYFTKCAVDSGARYMVQGITQYNGKFGCSWCENPGKVVTKGRGYCRIYEYENTNKYALREEFKFREMLQQPNFTTGIKFASPLLLLTKFDIINGFVVEPMHAIYIGVFKCFFNLICNQSTAVYYIGKNHEILNSRLLSVKVPCEIVRTTRDLNVISHWKASEFRTMLFVFPIVLKDLIPKEYHKHMCRLANSMFFLSQYTKKELSEKNYVRDQLVKFVQDTEKLYGEECMSFNVHIVSHLFQTFLDWGSLCDSSAFLFESFNAKLLKYIKSSNGAPIQVSRRYIQELQLRSLSQNVSFSKNEKTELFITRMLKLSTKFHILYEIKSPIKPYLVEPYVRTEIMKYSNAVAFFSGKKAYIKGTTFKIKETERRADCYVKINDICIGKIKLFVKVECNCILECHCCKEFAVIQKFVVKQLKYIKYGYYCSKDVLHEEIVLPITDICNEKFFKMDFDNNMYFLRVCNLVEID